MATSPTQRTLAECKRRGWVCQVVERWNPYAKVRQDLFGCIDVIAITPEFTIGIQATSDSNVSARVAKIKGDCWAEAWSVSPHRKLVVWGWGKKGKKGCRKLWTLREVEVV